MKSKKISNDQEPIQSDPTFKVCLFRDNSFTFGNNQYFAIALWLIHWERLILVDSHTCCVRIDGVM